MLIIIIPFERRKIEVHVFDRATLSRFAIREFTTKEDFNTKKQALHIKLKNVSYFLLRKSSYKKCFIVLKLSAF